MQPSACHESKWVGRSEEETHGKEVAVNCYWFGMQDCAWAGTGAESSTWRSPGNNDTVSTSHAQSSGMLLALNTAVLRIAPATQRRVLEDGAGIRKERWAAAVLALPLLMGPLPALHDDHGALVLHIQNCTRIHVHVTENAAGFSSYF